MVLTIRRDDKSIWAHQVGSPDKDDVKSNQWEKVRIQFMAEITNVITALATGYSLVVGIKKTKASTDYIASCSSWTESGQYHIGWLDLRNDIAVALPDGQEVYLEVKWTENGKEERSADLKLTISRGVITGDEDLPTNGNAAAKAAWLAAHILAGANITVTANTTDGTVTVASTAEGSAYAIESGCLKVPVDGGGFGYVPLLNAPP